MLHAVMGACKLTGLEQPHNMHARVFSTHTLAADVYSCVMTYLVDGIVRHAEVSKSMPMLPSYVQEDIVKHPPAWTPNAYFRLSFTQANLLENQVCPAA